MTAYPMLPGYLALASAVDPGVGITELSDTNYSRAMAVFHLREDDTYVNMNTIEFPSLTKQYAISGFGFYDAETSGNLLFYWSSMKNVSIQKFTWVSPNSNNVDSASRLMIMPNALQLQMALGSSGAAANSQVGALIVGSGCGGPVDGMASVVYTGSGLTVTSGVIVG